MYIIILHPFPHLCLGRMAFLHHSITPIVEIPCCRFDEVQPLTIGFHHFFPHLPSLATSFLFDFQRLFSSTAILCMHHMPKPVQLSLLCSTTDTSLSSPLCLCFTLHIYLQHIQQCMLAFEFLLQFMPIYHYCTILHFIIIK